ncbi:hypothetical protein WICPIJ_004806 [Wickerhamomyces pijperi]|uniref:Uncharacterized protein n=1 Tax=Wickerhamomyces pijperi TaxID=599730 RepID=A0A9P8Q7E9_WICPI|nr:hypothetical protein WICPIJ_004806 [Wickerhamomyces pijperi]
MGVNVLSFDVTSSESIIATMNVLIFFTILGSIFDVKQEELQWAIQVNVFGVFETIQAFQLILLKSKGTAVFTSYILDYLPLPFMFAYTGSKIAFTNIAKSLAGEVKELGIKVLVVKIGANHERDVTSYGW